MVAQEFRSLFRLSNQFWNNTASYSTWSGNASIRGEVVNPVTSGYVDLTPTNEHQPRDHARAGFVFTNYNSSNYTREVVASVYASGGSRRDEVVVVDNASSAADVAALKVLTQAFPRVHLLLNSENVGYFRGLNLGIALLRTMSPPIDRIVVGNNDIVFPKSFFDALANSGEILEYHSVVAPDLVTLDGVHQNPHVLFPISKARKLVWDVYFVSYGAAVLIRQLARFTRKFSVRPENAVGSGLFQNPGPIEQGYGACYILGPRFFKHFAKLCAPTFIMQEEFFLTEQLRIIGEKPYYDPNFIVLHYDHASVQQLPSRRHWELSREAHHIYKAYLRLPIAKRTDWIKSVCGDALT